MIIRGVECPECGGTRTEVSKAGFDSDGRRIRGRRCRECDESFTTVEVATPFNFARTDVTYPDRAKVRNGSMRSTLFFARDRLAISVRVFPGAKSPYCRKGLHLMAETAFIRKSGQRVCTACRKVAHRRWWELNRAKRPLKVAA